MSNKARITIRLSDELLAAVDRERRARHQTRSEFIQAAIKLALRTEQEQSAIKRYVAGYRRQPETADEVLAMHRIAVTALAHEPWEAKDDAVL